MEYNNETADNVDSISTERMKLLQNGLHKAVKEIIEGVSDEEFRKAICALPHLKNKCEMANKLHGKFNSIFVSNVTKRIDDLLMKENLDSKFSKLSVLEENNAAHEGEKAWRPPGNVQQHLRAPLITEKLKHIENLKKLAEEKEKAVEFLKAEVMKVRDQMNHQMKTLDELKEIADESAATSQTVLEKLNDSNET